MITTKKLIIVILCNIIPSVAIADFKLKMAVCAKISLSADRLKCYDELAKELNLEKPYIPRNKFRPPDLVRFCHDTNS